VQPCPNRHSAAFRLALAILAAFAFACGGGSSGSPAPTGSNPGDPTTSADAGTPPDGGTPQTPPAAVALDRLANGAVVAGPVDLSATAPANTSKVEFQVDGAVVATAPAAPFAASWDSFSVGNGTHTVAARALDASGAATASAPIQVTVSNHIRNVFVIVFENTDWSSVKGKSSAPYINNVLLAQGAHADRYMNVPGLHPSLPNYIWMEAGSNLGVRDDDVPSGHRLSGPHLVAQLRSAGVTWKAYQEDIPGTDCPLDYVNKYAPKHNPMIYFSDVNGGLDRSSSECIAHIRPYSELARDLEVDTVPAYSFITPNLCNDMHDCGIAAGDAWLSREVPKILASRAYKQGGALFVTFDESAGSDVPIGFIALSPLAKKGYGNQITYTHSSMLRSVQEIFGVAPLLGDAANAANVSDLFRSFP
jgi:phosphatidylinositol-3-phosphatase